MLRHLLLSSLLLFSVSGYAQNVDFSKVPGTAVTYSPASSGRYIGSPSLVILPNGNYLASHDFFGPKSNEHVSATSRVFQSTDRGKTWKQVGEIDGQFWSKLWVHQNRLFLFGTNRHHGNTIIRESKDEGATWTNPTDSNNGLLLEGEYHCAPMAFIEHNGRIWRAMEDAMGPVKKWGKRYGAFLMSIPVKSDPMIASNWTSSTVLRYDSTYLDGRFGGWLEGNAVVSPKGQILDILRVDVTADLPEKAAVVSISADGKNATFDPETDFVDFPGGSKKFTIRYDAKSKLYWTIANFVPDSIRNSNEGKRPSSIRNTQALASSKDLKTWNIQKLVLQHPDPVKHGFQYIDWLIQGNDILFLCRTAYDDGGEGARNNHDANFLTFHTIRDFRKTAKPGK